MALLPLLVLLLCVQWPLRDLVQAGSRLANDIAQCLFALITSVAVGAASADDAHLAARPVRPAWAARHRLALKRWLALLALLPWSLFLIASAAPAIWQSVRQLERFPESFNPGYFVVKLAVGLLALGVAAQALRDIRARTPDGR